MVVSVTSNEGMLQNIMDVFALRGKRPVASKGAKVQGLSVGAMGFSFGVSVKPEDGGRGFRYHITTVLDELKKKNIPTTILIDEVHNETPEMREFAITYQHLICEEYDISLMMAGLPSSVSDVLNDKVLTFLRRAYRIHLGNVAVAAVEVAYEAAFAEGGRSFIGDALSDAANGSFGYPYLIQLIGYYLWKNAGEKIRGVDVERAIKLSKADLFQNVHELLYRELSDKDKEFATAMVEDETKSAFGAIANRMGVTSGYASKYRERLLKSGIIHSSGYGKLAFSPPYMREYLIMRAM
jgi:hypothetical protein